MKRITKAVFPVAGMGTRFLPATKASPKEMMPVVDNKKPRELPMSGKKEIERRRFRDKVENKHASHLK